MTKAVSRFCFPVETLQQVRIIREAARHHLDRNDSAKQVVGGFIKHAHSPASDGFDNVVLTDMCELVIRHARVNCSREQYGASTTPDRANGVTLQQLATHHSADREYRLHSKTTPRGPFRSPGDLCAA